MFLSVLFTCMQRFKHVAQVHSEIRKCEKMSILHAMWHLKHNWFHSVKDVNVVIVPFE